MRRLIENTKELILAAQENQPGAMETLIKNNELLIWNVVKRFYGRGTEPEDLYQLGAMGFVKAVRGFQVERGLQLSTYAVPMIMGEIRRFLRDDGPVKVSRSIKETAMRAKRVAEKITAREGREAHLSEIAKELGVSEADVAAAYVATEKPDSINRPIYNKEECDAELEDVLEDGKRFDEELLTRISLSMAAMRLEKRDRQILVLRYFRNFTQSKVAEMMGISQVQVSRLEKKILARMRELMD